MHRNTFRKNERLCSEVLINRLFSEGKSIHSAYFRLIYIVNPATRTSPVQLLISVPKKKIRHAVDRNQAKRHIREAYRTLKHNLLDYLSETGIHIDMAIICTATQPIGFSETNAAINELLNRLIHIHEKAAH
jgi:ribonuclease P protein component